MRGSAINIAIVAEPVGIDRGPHRGGSLLEGDGQRVDLARHLSALVRGHLVGGGFGSVDALADGVFLLRRRRLVAHGSTWYGASTVYSTSPYRLMKRLGTSSGSVGTTTTPSRHRSG